MYRSAALALAILAATQTAAVADPSDDAEGYCDFVLGAARSDTALLLAPAVFVSFGVVNGNDASSVGTSSLPPTLRLTAGLRYDLGGIYQGITGRKHAEAECERYRAVSQLRRFLEHHGEIASGPALAAKAEVLKGALPSAEQILDGARRDVAHARASVEELNATALRVDALRALYSDSLFALDALPAPSPPIELRSLVRAEAMASDRVEQLEGRLRRARAWDVSVRAGYDQLFGLRDSLPLFGVVQVGVNLGALYQPVADARARRGRARFLPNEAEGVDQRITDALRRMHAALRAAERRRDETAVLFADLDTRMKAVERLDGERVKKYREYLWFDWVRLKAEHAYERALAIDLTASLAQESR